MGAAASTTCLGKGGFVFLPEVDDEVVLLRGANDTIDGLYLIGSVYNGAHVPTYTNGDGDNLTKIIRTRSGNEITISDKAGEEKVAITTKAGNLVEFSDKSGVNGIALKNADGTIDIKLDTNGAKITVANGKNTDIHVQGDTTIKSEGQINVESGANLSCKGSVNANFEAGAQLTVKGGAQVSVEAPMVKLQGSLVQIN